MDQKSSDKVISQIILGQPVGSVRIVIALFTLCAAALKLLYDKYLPDIVDFDEVRWTIISLGCVFFLSTFLRFKSHVLILYLSFFLYLSTLLYTVAFVLVNHFNPNAVAVLILVVGASTIIINSLAYYGVQAALIIFSSLLVFQGNTLSSENTIAFLNLILANGVFAIVMLVRLKLLSSVKNSHANLEKLQVLSIVINKNGEIVFISPSVYSLLGYDSRDLIKNGWWKYRNLSKGWISEEHIINFPNIMNKELLTMESSMVAKDGEEKWFSWANSVLPNGNYMGIGLDVTRYKVKQGQPNSEFVLSRQN